MTGNSGTGVEKRYGICKIKCKKMTKEVKSTEKAEKRAFPVLSCTLKT